MPIPAAKIVPSANAIPGVQGYLAHENTSPRKEPTVALRLGTYGVPMGVGVSYERGTPVGRAKRECQRERERERERARERERERESERERERGKSVPHSRKCTDFGNIPQVSSP